MPLQLYHVCAVAAWNYYIYIYIYIHSYAASFDLIDDFFSFTIESIWFVSIHRVSSFGKIVSLSWIRRRMCCHCLIYIIYHMVKRASYIECDILLNNCHFENYLQTWRKVPISLQLWIIFEENIITKPSEIVVTVKEIRSDFSSCREDRLVAEFAYFPVVKESVRRNFHSTIRKIHTHERHVFFSN